MSAGATPVAKQQLKATQILFIAFVAGIFLFLVVAMLLNYLAGPLQPSLNQYHKLTNPVVLIIAFFAMVFSRKVFSSHLTLAKDSLKSLSEKLTSFRIALIWYVAISEIPVLLSLVAFILTGNFVFEIYAAVFLGFMLTMFPTRRKVASLLDLDTQEQLAIQ